MAKRNVGRLFLAWVQMECHSWVHASFGKPERALLHSGYWERVQNERLVHGNAVMADFMSNQFVARSIHSKAWYPRTRVYPPIVIVLVILPLDDLNRVIGCLDSLDRSMSSILNSKRISLLIASSTINESFVLTQKFRECLNFVLCQKCRP
jgi:hypothetical protein